MSRPLAHPAGGFLLSSRQGEPLHPRPAGVEMVSAAFPAAADPTRPASLEARRLSKWLGDAAQPLPVLLDLSLQAGAGEFVVILGPSGCGKSTLFTILAGLADPDAGEILIDGDPAAQRLGRIAYMPQHDALFPWRTVLDNCLLAAEFQGRDRRRARREALDLLAEFGLDRFAGAYPASLSGGMRQRVAFLRTLLAHQRVLLLDEPFGALDALTRTSLREWLLDVWERHQQTILLVTHDVEEAVFLADRVYVLSSRPARVEAVVEVPFGRPRDPAILVEPSFVDLKARLLASLRPSLAADLEVRE